MSSREALLRAIGGAGREADDGVRDVPGESARGASGEDARDAAGAGDGAAGTTWTLRRARCHRVTLDPASAVPASAFDEDGFASFDIVVSGGVVRSIALSSSPRAERPPGSRPETDTGAGRGIDLGGRIVLPAFVDCHTHLDKGHIWPRRRNDDGTFASALENVGIDRERHWSAADVEARMEFSLRCAYAHGTRAIRTHLDSPPPQDAVSWPVFERVRERWAGRIELQGACLFGIEAARDERWLASIAARVAAAGGVLGTVTYPLPDLDALLERVFAAAIEHGLDLDFHADETTDPASRTLRAIADAARRHRFDGRLLVGHCCSLASQEESEVDATLDAVAAAGIGVVSLPLCNLYLQDRVPGPATPRRRGVTLLHEMRARGIGVAVASDNTRDPFHAYGDLDMLEVYRTATRVLHLDHPVADWPDTVLASPARLMGLGEGVGRLRAGDPADLTVFRGRSWTELLSRPESDRIVVRDGRCIDFTLPDYAELDHLFADRHASVTSFRPAVPDGEAHPPRTS